MASGGALRARFALSGREAASVKPGLLVRLEADGELLASADAAGRLYLWPWTDAAVAEQLRSATNLCLDADERVTWLDEPHAQAAQTAAACAPVN